MFRILVLENFEKLNNEGIVCNLLIGEEEVIKLGVIYMLCIIEKVNFKEYYDIVVIDEI